MKIFITVILFFFLILHIKAEIGVPPILNVSKNEYAASGQNWAIDADADGRIYIGNSKGLLLYYSGTSKLLSLPQDNYVYAVLVDNQRVYIGSLDEFGYFEKDNYGLFNYTSLSGKLGNYTYKNDEIQRIVLYQGKIYFQSLNALFVYDLGSEEISVEMLQVLFLESVNDKLYMYQKEKGLGIYEKGVFHLFISPSDLNFDRVVGLSAYEKDEILVLTAENGFYTYGERKCKRLISDWDDYLGSVVVNKGLMIKDSVYIIGTLNDGIYAFDQAKHFKWNVNTSNGLQNNTVHALMIDDQCNIWAALDNGFSNIQENVGMRFIKPFKKDIGSVFSAVFHDNYLYLATNQGVFYNKNNKQYFEVELMPGMSGETIDLQLIDDELICSHYTGTYSISGEKIKKLSDIRTISALCRGVIYNQQILAQATGVGLNIYKKDFSGKWYFCHTIEDFLHPINNMEIDILGNIWISYSNKGLFCVKLNSKLTGIDVIDHYAFPNGENNKSIIIFKIKGRVVFFDKEKYYTYDDLANTIVPFKLLNENLSVVKDIRKVIGIDDETYWCINSDAFIKFRIFNNFIKKEKNIPFSYFNWDLPDYNENVINNGMEKITFCLNNGIAVLNENSHRYPHAIDEKVEIESVNCFSKEDSKFLELYPAEKIIVPYSMNNLSFEILSNHSVEHDIQFVYQLKGLEDELFQLTSDTYKKYLNLPWGTYVFQANTFDSLGNEYSGVSYEFEIAPPFHATKLAIIIYILFTICFVFGIYFFIKRYIKKSNDRIAQEQEKLRKEELEIQEKEIIKLRNINLESELAFKSKELSNIAITLINKDKVLLDIRSELESQKEKLGIQFPNKYYNKLTNLVDANLSTEDNWGIFQTNFDRIHEGFFRNLKGKYPGLTPNDLKMCALLRLNLSTKDMASFLGITVRGAEFARYRLRKKMNLPTEKNIVDFLIEFK